MGKKGFTLIELLAVIVILAIVALIATPIILGIIRDSKENANKRSIDNYAKAVENAIAKYQLDGKKLEEIIMKTTDGRNFSNVEDFKVEYEGNVVCDTIEIYEDGNMYLDKCKVNGKLIDYKYGNFKTYIDQANVMVRVPTGLSPVIYKDNHWEIISSQDKWYDYNNQEWANAVILNDDVSKKPGTQLNIETDVKAIFVYIPRYSYTIGNTYGVQLEGANSPSQSTPGAIDIKFVSTKTKEKGSGVYTGNIPSGWYTHPAFTFGEEELEGIWVGKFQISHIDSSKSTTSLNCTNENCEEADNLRIIPNVIPLQNNVSNFFYGIRSMSRNKNKFNITGNTHMIKNSEWGAVAYFSQSKYGKYGNSNYLGVDKEIYQNKSFSGVTGMSNGTPPKATQNTQCSYDNVINNCGIGASTTGNIYGIYDMSGGKFEYVMGYLKTSSTIWGATSNGNYAGFTNKPSSKYYDEYSLYGNDDKGHAISEISTASKKNTAWYGDDSFFIVPSSPWVQRGSVSNSASTGMFSFNYYTGGVRGSSRVILIQN